MTIQEQIVDEIAQFTADPLGFVRFAYPWSEPGPLETESIRDWQADILGVIGKHLQSPFRFQPLKIAVASGHGIGKALAHGEPVLTPLGWRSVESLKIGDAVIAGDGTPTRVSGVFPQGLREMFRLTADDGASVLVDGEHRWLTTSRSERKHGKPGKVRTTSEIAKSLTFPNGPRLGLNHCIPLVGPVAFAEQILPIDPYIFGCWLGDGDAHGRITGVAESFKLLENAGASLGVSCPDKRSRAVTRSVLGIRPALRKLKMYGCRAHEKSIPGIYLLGSIEQRIAILQGLMDTDGSANDHGALTFEVVSQALADGVEELVRSLGGIVRRTTKMGGYSGKECRKVYRLFLSLPEWLIPFRCPRKLTHYRPVWAHRNCKSTRHRFIRSVEPEGVALATCIAVEHPSHLFVTRDYLVTHNTSLIAMISDWAMSTCDDCRVLVTANTEDQLTTKTWPEMVKWFGLSINKDWWNISATRITSRQAGHESTWRLDRETWSENNTEAFQGLHNRRKRIVLIFDEGSAIPKTVWDVAEGALTDEETEIIFLVFGNPTQNDTPFAGCFGAQKHRWMTRHIDSRTVPGTNKEQIDRWIMDFGEDSDFVRVRVRGEFPRAGGLQFIPQDLVAAARKRQCEPSGYKVMSADIARSGFNQTVVGTRQGPVARILGKWRGLSIPDQSGRIALLIMEQDPRCIIIDGDGIGGAVADHLRMMLPKPNQPRREWPDNALSRWFAAHPWFTVQEFHGGATPGDKFMYYNKRAEVWGKAKKWLEIGDIDDDPELERDLTGPRFDTDNPKSVIQLERKEDMRDRGVDSPDCADQLCYSFAANPIAETRDEKTRREQAAIKDPMELHFARLRETERRKQERQPLNYWQ